MHHGEYSLPDPLNKEATVDGVFYSDEVRSDFDVFLYASFSVKSPNEMHPNTYAVKTACPTC